MNLNFRFCTVRYSETFEVIDIRLITVIMKLQNSEVAKNRDDKTLISVQTWIM